MYLVQDGLILPRVSGLCGFRTKCSLIGFQDLLNILGWVCHKCPIRISSVGASKMICEWSWPFQLEVVLVQWLNHPHELQCTHNDSSFVGSIQTLGSALEGTKFISSRTTNSLPCQQAPAVLVPYNTFYMTRICTSGSSNSGSGTMKFLFGICFKVSFPMSVP